MGQCRRGDVPVDAQYGSAWLFEELPESDGNRDILIFKQKLKHGADTVDLATDCHRAFPLRCHNAAEGAEVIRLQIGYQTLLSKLPMMRSQVS
jgi:hypothetical protein